MDILSAFAENHFALFLVFCTATLAWWLAISLLYKFIRVPPLLGTRITQGVWGYGTPMNNLLRNLWPFFHPLRLLAAVGLWYTLIWLYSHYQWLPLSAFVLMHVIRLGIYCDRGIQFLAEMYMVHPGYIELDSNQETDHGEPRYSG